MKLYILRHEERYDDCSFFTPLTKNGLTKAKNLINKLDNCNIDLIFCSPFIRTLQTIYPYAKKKNLTINIDYSLSEIHHQDIMPIKSFGFILPLEIACDFNYNKNYKSTINPNEILYPEEYVDLSKRMCRFIKHIYLNYCNTNYNIVLVTHQSLCKSALKINKNIKNDEIIKNYPTGKFCQILDNNKWSFKEI